MYQLSAQEARTNGAAVFADFRLRRLDAPLNRFRPRPLRLQQGSAAFSTDREMRLSFVNQQLRCYMAFCIFRSSFASESKYSKHKIWSLNKIDKGEKQKQNG